MKLKKILYTSLIGVSFLFACDCDEGLNSDFKLQCGDFGIVLGGNHKSGCCYVAASEYNFTIKDKGRADNNISTKKIGDSIDLTIDSSDEFTGKVYSVIQENDKNISDINTTTWDSETEKNITIKNIKQISKNAYVYVKWETDDNDGEQNSTDKFAILPIKYVFDIPNQIKAGENYHIEINVTDSNDINQSYNQILDGSSDKNSTLVFIHKNGDKEDSSTIKLEFNSGVVDKNDFNISDIGNYRLELNDTNFAKVDEDDTPEINRTIYGYKDIQVEPYKFKINLLKHNTSNDKPWLYQGQEFNYTLEANITALNKNDEVLTHFDKDEYSTDVNATLNYILTKYDDKDINLTYIKKENNENIENQLPIQNGNYSVDYTIKDSNFTKGVSSIFGLQTYIKKDINNPNSPVDMNVSEVNTTQKAVENEGVVVDDNISYFYPKLDTDDIFTTYKETNTTAKILVYDNNKTDADSRFSNENMVLIDWYLNVRNDNTDILDMNMKESSKMDSNSIDINLTKSDVNSGKIEIEVDNNTTPKTTYGVIHLDTPLYLWYSKHNKPYEYTTDSDCINHYCIEYNYQSSEKVSHDVGSGNFAGPEVNNTLKTNTDRKGVKIFR